MWRHLMNGNFSRADDPTGFAGARRANTGLEGGGDARGGDASQGVTAAEESLAGGSGPEGGGDGGGAAKGGLPGNSRERRQAIRREKKASLTPPNPQDGPTVAMWMGDLGMR